MDNQDFNTVDAVQESVVDSQPNGQTETTESAQKVEVAEQPKVETKNVQSAEENAKFAEMRRARESAEQKAQQLEKDYQIAKKYGAEYGVYSEQDIINNYAAQGIKSFSEFEQAVERQKYVDKGIDPEVLDEYISNNPDVKWAREMKAQQEHQEYLANQVKALETYSPGIDINKLDPRVVEEFKAGKPLVDAYMKYEVEGLKAKLAEYEGKFKAQETNLLNEASSTGSLTGNGSNPSDFITYETFEANKHDQRWVIKNLSKINESRTKW